MRPELLRPWIEACRRGVHSRRGKLELDPPSSKSHHLQPSLTLDETCCKHCRPRRRQIGNLHLLLYKNSILRVPPPWTRCYRWSGASTGWERVWEDLLHSDTVAITSLALLGNLTQTLGPTPPAGKRPAISASLRHPASHRRRKGTTSSVDDDQSTFFHRSQLYLGESLLELPFFLCSWTLIQLLPKQRPITSARTKRGPYLLIWPSSPP